MKLKFNKNDPRYWMRKVSFHTKDSRTYSVHIQHGNRRRRVGLRTTDKEQAGVLALKFYAGYPGSRLGRNPSLAERWRLSL